MQGPEREAHHDHPGPDRPKELRAVLAPYTRFIRSVISPRRCAWSTSMPICPVSVFLTGRPQLRRGLMRITA